MDDVGTGMRAVTFRSAVAGVDRQHNDVVIALFNGSPARCVGILRTSPQAAEALRKALGSIVKSRKR
jgi:hypothetical protein